jgi:hypothetical protein
MGKRVFLTGPAAFALALARAARAFALVASAALVLFCSCANREASRQAVQRAASGGGIVREGDQEGSADQGRVFGEFEDLGLFERELRKRPTTAGWNDKQVWDGLSGATIQAKTMGPKVPDRVVLLDGEILAYADGFGQYWLALPPGTYSLTGRCEGYEDAIISVEVRRASTSYANFYLERKKN